MSVTLEDAAKTSIPMIVSKRPRKQLSQAEKNRLIKLSEEMLLYSPRTHTFCGKGTSPPRRRKTVQ